MQTLYPRSEADLIRIFEVANASQLTLRWGHEAACTGTFAATAAMHEESAAKSGLRFNPNTHLNKVLALDAAKRLIIVQPGVRFSQLNAMVRPHGLCLPIFLTNQADPTIESLVRFNSLADNFLQNGRAVHYVAAIDAVMADASSVRFSTFGDGGDMVVSTAKMSRLVPQLFEVSTKYQAQIAAELGAYPWRKNGYNLDIFDVSAQTIRLYNPNRSLNLAHLLVGSFGQLAFAKRITLRLADLQGAAPSASLHNAPEPDSGNEPISERDARAFGTGPAFSAPLLEAFGRVKQLFDPENRLHPVGASSVGTLQE